MATDYPTYPATTFEQAVELTIFSGNQMHDVVNGDAQTEVETESGNIPTVRKALVENIYFKYPLPWANGTQETVFNQLRFYSDQTVNGWFYAPSATALNPVNMLANPVGDSNWVLFGSTPSPLLIQYVRRAEDAAFDAEYSAGEASRSADEAAQYAADSAGLQRPYKDVAAAQAAINAGEIENGAVFSIVGTDPNVSYEFYFNNAGTATAILDTNGKPKIFPNMVWFLSQLILLDFNATHILPNAGIINYGGENAFEITSLSGQLALFLDRIGKMTIPSGLFNLGTSKFETIPEESEYALAFSDDKGATTFGIGKEGWVELLGMRLYKTDDNGDCFSITDAQGATAFKVTNEGKVEIPDLKGGGNGGITPTPFLDFAERLHLFIYGQSLSNGAIGTPVLGTPTTDALMYNTGVRSFGVTPTSLTDLQETNSGTNGETIASGLAHGFVNSSGGMYDRKLILNAGGVNGARIEEISKGTSSYTQLVNQMRSVATWMTTEGREYSPDFVFFMQGEGNMAVGTSAAQYATLEEQLYSDLNTDTQSIRSSGLDLVMFTYQTSSHGYYIGTSENPSEVITQAQLQVALTHPNIDMWGPTYMGLPGNHVAAQGNVHHNNHGYRLQGLYAQKALRHRLRTRSPENPQGEKYLPVHVTEAKKINDNTVLAKVHTYFPPLVIDSSLVSELPDGNHGVELWDNSGRLPITGVSIVGGTKIKVITSATIGAGAFIAFAWTPDNRGPITNNRYNEWFFGRETGVRTTIHDSDPEITDLTNEAGIPYPLHNYLAIQKVEVI